MNKKITLVVIIAIASTYIAYGATFPFDYESKTKEQKLNFIWEMALNDNGDSGKFPSIVEQIPLYLPVSFGGLDLSPVGHNVSDENKLGRRKLMFSVSKNAKIRINFEPNPFTGAFAEKECIGILRASAKSPPSIQNTVPGMAIKILRDKAPSGNVVAMWEAAGQDFDTNFFTHAMSNHINKIPPFNFGKTFIKEKSITKKFLDYDEHVNMVGLSDLAKYKNDGTRVSSPLAPFALVFKPNEDLVQLCYRAPLEGSNFGCFRKIAKGTKLYDIFYVESPTRKKDVTKNTLK